MPENRAPSSVTKEVARKGLVVGPLAALAGIAAAGAAGPAAPIAGPAATAATVAVLSSIGKASRNRRRTLPHTWWADFLVEPLLAALGTLL